MARGISALTYLNQKLGRNEMIKCLNVFIEKKFLAYNYEKEEYEDACLLLCNEYLERKRRSLRYQTEDFVFSCSESRDFLTYCIDGDNHYSEIILEVADRFAEILSNLEFSYIDVEGDRPDCLSNSIKETTINTFFKYNYFGAKYIEKYGKDFFRNIPAKNIFFISDKVVRIDMADSIFLSIETSLKKKIRTYLNGFGINSVEFYDASKCQY